MANLPEGSGALEPGKQAEEKPGRFHKLWRPGSLSGWGTGGSKSGLFYGARDNGARTASIRSKCDTHRIDVTVFRLHDHSSIISPVTGDPCQ